MGKDVNIHVKAQGTEQSKRKIDSTTQSVNQLGNKADSAGRKGAKGLDELNQSGEKSRSTFSRFGKNIAGWVSKMAGAAAIILGITKAINANSQAMEENAQIAEDQQRKLLRLQFLGGFFRDRPELRKEVVELSELGRRPFDEVADAFYNLRSKSGSLDPQQRRDIMLEALELGRTDPDTPLDTLIDMFSLYAKKTGQPDINRIQNVLQQTITEAGGSTGDVSRYFPEFLPIGLSGGLSAPQAAGLWSYATTQTSEASIATTGLKALFLGLQGKGTPEGAKILEGLGIDQDANFFQKIFGLSQQAQAGKFGLGQAEQIAGREGASILLDLTNNPAAMIDTVRSVVSKDRGDIDVTRSMLDELMGQDEMARLEEGNRQLDVEIENIKGDDIKAVRFDNYLKRVERDMRKKGLPEYEIAFDLWVRRFLGGAGATQETFDHPMLLEPFGQSGDQSTSALDAPAPLSPPDTEQPTQAGEPLSSNTNIYNFHNDINYYRGEGQASARVGPDDVA